MRRLLLVLLLLVAVPVLPPASAQSPEPQQGVGVAPPPGARYASASGTFLELGQVRPGTPVTGAVLLQNPGSAARRVFLYASDALPSRGGGFGFSDRTAADSQVGSWLVLDRAVVTVPARGQVSAAFRLVVPAGAEGGEYVGGVVAEPADTPTGSGLQTATRAAMAVYLTVTGGRPGATPGRGRPDGRLEVVDLATRPDGSRTCPVLTYRNDSQQILDVEVRARTRGLIGGSSYRKDRVGAVLPGSEAAVALPCLDRPLGPGTLRVDVSAPTGASDYTERLLYLPPALVAALLLLLLLVLAVVTTALRGRRRTPGTPPSSPS